MSGYAVCKNATMFKYHRLLNGLSQTLPFVCFAELEVRPRSLSVPGRRSGTELHLPSPSLVVKML